MKRISISMQCLALLLAMAFGCTSSPGMNGTPASESLPSPDSLIAKGPVRTGAHVLRDKGFQRLAGKRIGLIVNHTALVDSVHLIDIVHGASGVELGALFGPEHGIRGQVAAGEEVASGRDSKTGAPIYSLYGETRKPTPEMLEDIDALVFDIQDVGARFYTYISTMGLAMQAAAEAGIPFIILDRPNPIGGMNVEGPLLEEEHESFVGLYPIPIAHGLTVGELAQMIKGERMLAGLENLDLQVVTMEGWTRDMLWPETGLPWIPPSPNIPDFETALVYPGAGFFEATSGSEGRGTMAPFLQVGASWADGEQLAAELNRRYLPGVTFEPVTFTPRDIPGMATNPKLEGETVEGVRYRITDPAAFEPVVTGVHILQTFYQYAPPEERDEFINRPEWLAKLSGTTQFFDMLTEGASPEEILAAWKADVDTFLQKRSAYLLYE